MILENYETKVSLEKAKDLGELIIPRSACKAVLAYYADETYTIYGIESLKDIKEIETANLELLLPCPDANDLLNIMVATGLEIHFTINGDIRPADIPDAMVAPLVIALGQDATAYGSIWNDAIMPTFEAAYTTIDDKIEKQQKETELKKDAENKKE